MYNAPYRYAPWRDSTLTDWTEISYGDLKPEAPYNSDCPSLIVPEYLAGSDYSGGSVTVANRRAFMRDFADLQGKVWWDVFGGYGSYGIAILADHGNDEISEWLDALADYPVADENLLEEVEYQATVDAWESMYRRDFVDAIESTFAVELDSDSDDDEVLSELLSELMELSNTYWEHETGGGAYLDVNRVLSACTRERVLQLPGATALSEDAQ